VYNSYYKDVYFKHNVKYLVEQGVDKDRANKEGYTALHYAAKNGHFDIVEYLLKQVVVTVNLFIKIV